MTYTKTAGHLGDPAIPLSALVTPSSAKPGPVDTAHMEDNSCQDGGFGGSFERVGGRGCKGGKEDQRFEATYGKKKKTFMHQ